MHWEYSNIAKMSKKDFGLLFNNLNTVFVDLLSKDNWKDRRSLLLNEYKISVRKLYAMNILKTPRST